MKRTRTITFSLPEDMGQDVEKIAAEEQRTISEMLREMIRSYRARRNLKRLSEEGRAQVKKLGLKPEDFGGPFED